MDQGPFFIVQSKKVLRPFSIFSPKRSSVVFDQPRWNKSSNGENKINTIKSTSFFLFLFLCILHININFKREEDQKDHNSPRKQINIVIHTEEEWKSHTGTVLEQWLSEISEDIKNQRLCWFQNWHSQGFYLKLILYYNK